MVLEKHLESDDILNTISKKQMNNIRNYKNINKTTLDDQRFESELNTKSNRFMNFEQYPFKQVYMKMDQEFFKEDD